MTDREAAIRMPSLTTRLVLALALLLAAGGGAVAVAALAYGRHAANQAYDRLLIGAANQISESLHLRGGSVGADIPMAAFELLALAPDDRVIYAVIAPHGRVVTGYEGVEPAPAGQTFHTGSFTGEPVRLATVRRRFVERAFTGTVEVVVGQTTRSRAELAREITRGALWLVAGAGLLMSGLAAFAVRSALGPLRRIEDRLASRTPEDLTPLDLAVPREIGSLVAGINGFMGRLDRQLATMRRLISDASHQLRTPIAALRVQAELAADEPDPERQRAIVARIHDRAQSLGRLTDQLLSQALVIHRADAVPRERLDLRTVAIRTVEDTDHAHLADAASLRLDLPDDPVWCEGDALSLVEACKNLVANALRYGEAPVTLAATERNGEVWVAVRDRGPGIPEAQWSDAGTRFARTTGVSPTSAGLGLAIVTAVASAHRGALRFGRTAAGEFEAALALPPAQRPGA